MPTKKSYGFTIVELLIVIVVIGILAAITIVAYNGIQDRAKAARILSDVNQVAKKIEIYNATNGSYPSTGGMTTVRTDDNCPAGSSQADWVPGVDGTLPQSVQPATGAYGETGCYMYASDGTVYLLTAWNMLKTPQTQTFYRRQGFREQGAYSANLYLCNYSAYIGGVNSGVYALNNDIYKRSYTITNITTCNETPPSGA